MFWLIMVGLVAVAAVFVWWAPAASRCFAREVKACADQPCAFGYQMAWIAVRTRDTAGLIDALHLNKTRLVGWSQGMAAVYDERTGLRRVFVTPPVDGWSFVIGLSLPHPMGTGFDDRCHALLAELSEEFGDVQYYASYPALEYFGWVMMKAGTLRRGFAVGPEGVIWNRGRVTPEERALGSSLFQLRVVDDGIGAAVAVDGRAIGERDVLTIARQWSVDPTSIEGRDDLYAGLGYAGRVPADWSVAASGRWAA